MSIVVHAAALKQVPALEYNPFEAIKTNVLGSYNVIRACVHCKVPKLIALSTDKAASPVNLYGATKLCQDKLMVAANHMYPDLKVSVVRYGNVFGSRGSVIPVFLRQKEEHARLTITDSRMSRFTIMLPEGVAFVLHCLHKMRGGEIFIPKIPSYRIGTLANAIANGVCQVDEIGIRPGEKLHEVMIPEDEACNTLDFGDHFTILPGASWYIDKRKALIEEDGGVPTPAGFSYSSGANTDWIDEHFIRKQIETQ